MHHRVTRILADGCITQSDKIQWCSIQNLRQYISTIWIGYVWAMITYLKSATMLFSKVGPNRYGIGLSNELLFIIIAQGAAKLWSVNLEVKILSDIKVQGSALLSKFEFYTYLKLLFDFQIWQVTTL